MGRVPLGFCNKDGGGFVIFFCTSELGSSLLSPARWSAIGLNELGAYRLAGLRRRLEPEVSVRADVSNLADLDTMFATIKREFGHLDGIFVNAGYSDFRLFEEVTEQSFDKVLAGKLSGSSPWALIEGLR